MVEMFLLMSGSCVGYHQLKKCYSLQYWRVQQTFVCYLYHDKSWVILSSSIPLFSEVEVGQQIDMVCTSSGTQSSKIAIPWQAFSSFPTNQLF